MARRLTLDMDRRCVEPVKRMCGGTGPRWVVHRYPIKGGLPLRVIWQREMLEALTRQSFFSRFLKAKGGPIVQTEGL